MTAAKRLNRDLHHITRAAWTARELGACVACYLIVAAFPLMLIAAAYVRGWRPL